MRDISMMELFEDRIAAGKLLSKKLLHYKNNKDTIVLALPRGGVPVGFQVAKILKIPLDVFLVRKLGVPGQEELAMGAIASGGITFYNDDLIQSLEIPKVAIDAVIAKELQTLQHREKLYRKNKAPLDLKDKTVILIDDGIATGATIRVAIKALTKQACKKIIVAAPVMPSDTYEQLKSEVAEIFYLTMPYPFYAIGVWYQDFSQTSDEEVIELLNQAESFG